MDKDLLLTDLVEQADTWARYYAKLATPAKSPRWNRDFLDQATAEVALIKQQVAHILAENIKQVEVVEALRNLDKGKAADLTSLLWTPKRPSMMWITQLCCGPTRVAASYLANLIAGAKLLQTTRAKFNQFKINRKCPLCQKCDETYTTFIRTLKEDGAFTPSGKDSRFYFLLNSGAKHVCDTRLAKKVVTPQLKTVKPMWIKRSCFHLAEIGMILTRDCSPTKSDTTLGRHSMQGQVGSSSSETIV